MSDSLFKLHVQLLWAGWILQTILIKSFNGYKIARIDASNNPKI